MSDLHISVNEDPVVKGTLIVTRGLPGAGKTTKARAWVAECPEKRVAVSRDDLQLMLFDGWTGSENALLVRNVEFSVIEMLLREDRDVVVHDTFLDPQRLESVRAIANYLRINLIIWDMRYVPLEVCISRNAERTGKDRVSEQVIRALHAQWIEKEGREK